MTPTHAPPKYIDQPTSLRDPVCSAGELFRQQTVLDGDPDGFGFTVNAQEPLKLPDAHRADYSDLANATFLLSSQTLPPSVCSVLEELYMPFR
jgi:hypothetical protein